MRIDPTHALDLVGRLRAQLLEIPREATWRNVQPTVADTVRAIRALRPLVAELEELRTQLRHSLTRPLTFAEQELRRVLSSVIALADDAGVTLALYPGQEEDERTILGVSS